MKKFIPYLFTFTFFLFYSYHIFGQGPADDGLCDPPSTIGTLDPPADTFICRDGSNTPTLTPPTSSLPDIEFVLEKTGGAILLPLGADGTIDPSNYDVGDEICYSAFAFDLVAINDLLSTVSTLCAALDCDAVFGIPGLENAIDDLINGTNDGVAGVNDLSEVLLFLASFGTLVSSVQQAVTILNDLNTTISPFNLGPVCYAVSNSVCFIVEDCENTCPTIILNDNNFPSLPPASCAGDILSLCFDIAVDEATFDPSLIQFGYNLTIEGYPATVTLNTSYSSGTAVDPAATGQLCFEAIIPAGTNPCTPYELSLQIIDFFYNDAGCPNGFIAYDFDITDPFPIMLDGININDLIPTLSGIGINQLIVQIFPNPNWLANVVQLPLCDEVTLGTIEIFSADGTLCETLTDIGIAGMDGCPSTSAILSETLYENYTTFTDADGMEQPNPCAVNIIIPEQITPCEDQCIECPTVANVTSPNTGICPDASSVTFCVEVDVILDANTILTVDGVSTDGSAGGMQICVDVPILPFPGDFCSSSTMVYDISLVCNGTDLLDGIEIAVPILPITDPSCGGIAGCTDNAACNYNADADCDNGSCDLGNTACPDPCNEPNPDDGCALTTDTFDAATCTITNTPNCAADETFDAANCACIMGGIPGCLDQCDPNYNPDATIDDPTLCIGIDVECNSDCLMGDITIFDPTTCFCEVFVVTVLGCTDSNADNYDPAANCDDGSCMIGPCEDMIAGSVITEETGCSPAGIEVTIYYATGAVVGTATTDADGNYALMGVFSCGDYQAELTANIPGCFVDSGGNVGPLGFTINGDGNADGVVFTENQQIPTLSQWGLMLLALLLMIFGALKLSPKFASTMAYRRMNY